MKRPNPAPAPLPRQATFEITHGCNFRCVHCYGPFRKPGRGELDRKGVRAILKKLADAGVLHVSFTGGEPFARPDFLDIVRDARSMRFSAAISTNGSLLDAEKIRLLAELKPTRIAVSLYGASEKTYRAVTGRRGMFRRVAAAIDGLLDSGINAVLAMPAVKENFKDIDAAIKIAEKRVLGIKISCAITGCMDGSTGPLKHELAPRQTAELVKAGVVKIRRLKRAEKNMCGAGFDMPAISPDGLAYPCLEIRTPFADLKKDDFIRAWRTSPALVKLRKARWADYPACFKCGYFDYCRVCPAEAAILQPPGKKRPIQCRKKRTLEKILPLS
jgi:radical SAM protein with 4Fe4S-binding SPASM domain